jgi:hypothetical protein
MSESRHVPRRTMTVEREDSTKALKEVHVAERYFMYDPALRVSVLRVVQRWKRLPLSDLFQLLPTEDRLRYRDDVIEDLAWQGLIQKEERGDETVVSITPSGEQANLEAESASSQMEAS